MSKCEHGLTSKECYVCASPKVGKYPAMTKIELPPLPGAAVDEHNLQGGRLLYSREQLIAFARAAVEADRAARAAAPAGFKHVGKVNCHISAELDLVIGTDLYIAAAPAQVTANIGRAAAPACKCDLRTKLVGDGCEVCNQELAAELQGCNPKLQSNSAELLPEQALREAHAMIAYRP